MLESGVASDVLVNNPRDIGPGHMDRFMDTPLEILDMHLKANVIAQLALMKRLIPGMIERGQGTIVQITSAAAYGDPMKPAGDGGWGMGYGVSKGAFQRIAGFIDIELGSSGIRCFNLSPGSVATERIAQDMAEFGIPNKGAPADVVGAVVAWLATSPDADQFTGTNLEAQFVCAERKLFRDGRGLCATRTTFASMSRAPRSTGSRRAYPAGDAFAAVWRLALTPRDPLLASRTAV